MALEVDRISVRNLGRARNYCWRRPFTSDRQVEFLLERGKSWVVAQALQEWFQFYKIKPSLRVRKPDRARQMLRRTGCGRPKSWRSGASADFEGRVANNFARPGIEPQPVLQCPPIR